MFISVKLQRVSHLLNLLHFSFSCGSFVGHTFVLLRKQIISESHNHLAGLSIEVINTDSSLLTLRLFDGCVGKLADVFDKFTDVIIVELADFGNQVHLQVG
jgi:hypothetical protein